MLERGIYAEETKGDLAGAIAIYEELIAEEQKLRSYAAQATYRAAQCYIKQGDVEKGASTLSNLIQNHPGETELIASANKMLARLTEKIPPTELEAKTSVELGGNGWDLWRRGTLEDAKMYFEKSVELDPGNANSWNGLGWTLSNLGSYTSAGEAFEKCLALEPEHPAALNGMGWVADVAGDIQAAIGYWEKAVEILPTGTAALNGLAKTFMSSQNWEKGAKYNQMILDVEPGNIQAKRGLSYARAKLDSQPPSLDPKAALVEKVKRLAGHKSAAFSVIPSLINELSPDDAYEVVREAWPSMQDFEVKRGTMKAFAFRDHPRVLGVLDLGMTDEHPNVTSTAKVYLSWYAFQDFANDYTAYAPWYEEFGHQPLEEVILTNCRRAIRTATEAEPSMLVASLKLITDSSALDAFPSIGEMMVEEELLTASLDWMKNSASERDLRRAASTLIQTMDPGEDFLRNEILPLVTDQEIGSHAIRLLRDKKHKWVVEPLTELLIELSEQKNPQLWNISTALGEIASPAAIPAMIAVIDRDNTYHTVYGVGYFGLGKITGVKYNENHDGPWWRAWWGKNKDQYPEEIRSLDIPELPPLQAVDQ
jgi:tetratricopeptide (TPR) repeat protein